MPSSSEQKASFSARCYALLKEMPEGRITSYKEIAKALNTKAYRAVGSAMARNKDLVTIPCHRVIRSDGQVGAYVLGTEVKIALLEQEGVKIIDDRAQDFETLLFRFEV